MREFGGVLARLVRVCRSKNRQICAVFIGNHAIVVGNLPVPAQNHAVFVENVVIMVAGGRDRGRGAVPDVGGQRGRR